MRAALVALSLLLAPQVQAQIEHRESQLHASMSTVSISSNYAITLEPAVREALQNGIPLVFLYEVELYEPRFRGWWKYAIANAEQLVTLSYDPLLQNYQVRTLSLRLAPDLEQAQQDLGRRQLIQPFPRKALLEPNRAMRARLSLDRNSLPGPMRLTAWLDAAWHEDSGWHSITLPELAQ
ncbi:MAG: DUF4390 domain-containing protein [Gammaproteobacteria bacterium]